MIETIGELTARYPKLCMAEKSIEAAEEAIIKAYRNGKILYACGNGGSSADADHIVGELMKGFLKNRSVPHEDREKLRTICPETADFMADNLQCGLPAISLHSQSALLTAFANDVDASMMYAQVIYAMGREGDVLPEMSDEFVASVSDRYIELYEHITGEKFVRDNSENIESRIEENVKNMLARLL